MSSLVKKRRPAFLAAVLLIAGLGGVYVAIAPAQTPTGQTKTSPSTAPSKPPAAQPEPASRPAVIVGPPAAATAQPTLPPKYDDMIGAGYELLQEGKLKEAYTAALSAATLDANRFEAYALAALALHGEGSDSEANQLVSKALGLAPADKRAKLNELAKVISDSLKTAAKVAEEAKTPPELRRKRDALEIIMSEVDQATGNDSRRRLLQELLEKSELFLKEYPNETKIWVLNGAAAVELDNSKAAWEAGRALKRLKADDSDDSSTRRFLATMERKGWLGANPPLTKEQETERQRAADFSGFWRCLEKSTITFQGERSVGRSLHYFESKYSDGRFIWAYVLGSTPTAVFQTDGVLRPDGQGPSAGHRKSTWRGGTLVSNFDFDSGKGLTDRFRIADGNLIYESRNEAASFDEDTTCERVSEEEATLEVSRIRTNTKAAVDELMSFVRTNALKVSNLTVDYSTMSCTLKWAGPEQYFNDPPKQRNTGLFADFKYEVEKDDFAEAYHVGYDFYFPRRDLASHYIDLARKAGNACHNFQ
jgi:tetratricopeptide (TPR) repeat protein